MEGVSDKNGISDAARSQLGWGIYEREEEEEEAWRRKKGWDLGYRSLSSLSKAEFYYWWWLNDGSNEVKEAHKSHGCSSFKENGCVIHKHTQ